MKKVSLQNQYNVLHITYWICTVCIFGFSAILLGSKGLNNVEIGATVGGASLLSTLLSPAFTSFVSSKKNLSLQTFLSFGLILIGADFLFLCFVNLPPILLMGLFMIAMSSLVSTTALLSQISMAYIEQGENVNFGISRGLGSVSYALFAVLLSQMMSFVPASFLSVVYLISAALFMICAKTMKPVYAKAQASSGKSLSMVGVAARYPSYFIILLGLCLAFSCQSGLGTYLIRLVEAKGGTQSLYGIAVFCMAASELPFLAVAPKLIKRFGTMPLIAAGALFYLVRNCGTVLAPNLPMMLMSLMFQGASYGLLTAVITYHTSLVMKQEHQVMGQTMFIMMTSGFGSSIGNFLGGWIIDNFGLSFLSSTVVVITILGAAIMCVTALAAVKGFKTVRPAAKRSVTKRALAMKAAH